ncbi:acyltransferase family protein [Ferribacterium limneticum]|uniref:acyltransferase family protein n=1 Tax=Ferribacterium limneticum TaxID=76259 RepID=UPI001CFC44B6|nr:acyltransferase family protein [Ferribacterium limneticum]UCV20463.1 acyltransferase [Ferribacterium limneticum]
MTSPPNENFRKDINGLRALAVIAVVFYHFRISGFHGGFIGVDIFFVISGYLMTRIILSASESGKFSLSAFYLARAKRIVPALLVMCVTLLAVGWFLPLTAYEYQQLAKHVRDSAIFVSNHTYARESGYFDTAAHEKWLLHTWSLSVEWQFYLVLPLLLLVFKKIRQTASPRYFLVLLLIASLVSCLYATATKPEKAFFFLPFRAWELLSGGLIYLFAEQKTVSNRLASRLATTSVFLLFLSILFLSPTDPWPGWRAIFPVLISGLIIAVRDDKNPILTNPAVQWIGLRSYSIYLWHWPFVVALGLYGWQENAEAIFAGLIATLIMGLLSYRHIETPARQHLKSYQTRSLWLVFAGVMIALTFPASWLSKQHVLPQRTQAYLAAALLADEPPVENAWRPECFNGSREEGCLYGKAPVGAMMIGDSHASVTVTALQQASSAFGRGVQLWSKGACMTVLDIQSIDRADGARCKAFNTHALTRTTAAEPGVPVVIVNRVSLYPFGLYRVETHLPGRPQAILPNIAPDNQIDFLADYRRRLIETACSYAKSKRPVYYMLPIPEFHVNVPNALARNIMRKEPNSPDITITLADYHKRNDFVIGALKEARDICGVRLLDPVPYLCEDDKCFGSRNGRPLFSDNNHLNERGRHLLAPMFKVVLNESKGWSSTSGKPASAPFLGRD